MTTDEHERFLWVIADRLQDALAGERTKENISKDVHSVRAMIMKKLRPPLPEMLEQSEEIQSLSDPGQA